jgi:hypothetical protein
MSGHVRNSWAWRWVCAFIIIALAVLPAGCGSSEQPIAFPKGDGAGRKMDPKLLERKIKGGRGSETVSRRERLKILSETRKKMEAEESQ